MTLAASGQLRRGHTRSCGCLRRETTSKRVRVHGLTESSEYKIWCHIKQRCHNSKSRGWRHYGAKGVSLYPAWRESFCRFIADVGRKPSAKHTLDRYPNPRGNYEPGNVRWATMLQQGRNRRNNRLFTFSGETLPLSEWSERLGIPYGVLYYRVVLNRWDTERAFTQTTDLYTDRRGSFTNGVPIAPKGFSVR